MAETLAYEESKQVNREETKEQTQEEFLQEKKQMKDYVQIGDLQLDTTQFFTNFPAGIVEDRFVRMLDI